MVNISPVSIDSVLKYMLEISANGTEEIEISILNLLIADCIRKHLCTLSSIGDTAEPVYTTRLITTVTNQLIPLFKIGGSIGIPEYSEEQLDSSIRNTLKVLETMRDIVYLGKGYWLPGPIRFIDLKNSRNAFVIGCLPTYTLRSIYGPIINVSGLSRFVDKTCILESVKYPIQWQKFDDWLGKIPSDLIRWTQSNMKTASKNLRPSASNFDKFQVYCAWDKRKFQYYRWLDYENYIRTLTTAPNQLFLCRSKTSLGPRKYWFGKLSLLSLESEYSLSGQIIRRLMYGLDLANNNPVSVNWSGNTVILNNWLPPEELRILMTAGLQISTEIGKFPIMFDVHQEMKPFINEMLLNLGIIIREA